MDIDLSAIIKLGGASITKKSTYHSLDILALDQVAKGIRGIKNVIIVHGAGSFGHFEAVQYDLVRGFNSATTSPEDTLKGFCKTRAAVLNLHQMVLTKLIENQINAFGISPSTWKMEDGILHSCDLTGVEELLAQGFVPILHGDCVKDLQNGYTILSGDLIVEVLSERYKPKRVVFVSDVAGVYDRDPNDPDATLLRDIKVSDYDQQNIAFKSGLCDVTGGMKSKLVHAVNIAKLDIPVYVVNKENAGCACLEERREGTGTKITL